MLKTLSLLFAVLAGLLLVVGAGFAVWTLVFLNRSEVAAGTVIRLDDEGLADRRSGARMTRPIIRFTTASGARIEFAHGFASTPPAYAVGESVIVRYDQASPAAARIDSPFSLWFIPGLVGGLGAIFGTVAVILIVLYTSHTRARAHLVAHGVRHQGRVVSVERQYFTKGGDKRMLHAVTVDATDPATGATRRFEKRGFRASDVDHLKPGDAMTVIVDTRDPESFALDLPETATR
jgi:hypothetical protein